MAGRGVVVVVLVALGLGAGALALRRLGTPTMKLPGPCEVVRTMPEPPPGLPELPPERLVYAYDAQGHRVLEQRMLGTHMSESTRWEHDDAGRVVLEERFTPGPIHQTDADGTQRVLEHAIARTRLTYDAQGRMLTRTYERVDSGLVPHVTRYAYDASGLQLGAHAEWEGKHASDTTFEHDAEGRLVAERSDGDAVGHKTYEHDAQGRVIREANDAMADGTIDLAIERRYDDAGRVVFERETGFMGTREIDYAHDDAGNVLSRRERAMEPNAGVTVLDTYDYACWRVEDGRPVDDRPPPPP